MTSVTATGTLAAPPAEVFALLDDPAACGAVVPEVVSVEVLGDTKTGKGTRFRETRKQGKRQMTMEFEVVEAVHPEHIRTVCDSHGTTWDAVYRIEPHGDGTRFTITMDARGHGLLQKVLNPLMRPLFRKGLTEHIATLQAHLRAGQESVPGGGVGNGTRSRSAV